MSGHGVTPHPDGQSPGQETLDVLHKRLISAEEDAHHLAQQLTEMGFDPESQTTQNNKHEPKTVRFNESHKQRKKDKGSLHDAITPFKVRVPDTDAMFQNYDSLVARVCRMESTVQGLKLKITQAQAERDLSKKEKVAANEKLASATDGYEKEIHRLNRDLAIAQKNSREAEEGRRQIEDVAKRLQHALEKSGNLQTSVSIELEQLRTGKAKLQKRVTELKHEMERESSLRTSLEESHNTLLKRIQDMEKIVESERDEVKTMSANCTHMKKDSVQARDEAKQEAQLRRSAENQLLTMKNELDNRQKKIVALEEDKRLLMDEIHKLHKQYTELNGQIDRMHHLVEDKQSTYKQLQNENKQLYASMKSAAAQNAQLIAKYEHELESGMLEKAGKIQTEENVKQLEDQLRAETREKVQAENKCAQLEKQLSDLQGHVQRQEDKSQSSASSKQQEVLQLQGKLKEVEEEKDKILKDKDNLLDEVNQAVDSMTEERGRLEQQLQEASVEINSLEQSKKHIMEENRRLSERIASMEDHHSSQKHMEQTMTDMLEQKNKLAYDKGRLQSKVEQLQGDLESLALAQTDLTQAKRTNSTLEAKVTKLQAELSASTMAVQRLESQVKQSFHSSNRKEKDFEMAVKARDEALKEAQRLLKHIEALEGKEKLKETALQQNLSDTREDNKKMAATLETIMQSHAQLQVTLESLQIDLGRKDSMISQLRDERTNHEDRCRKLQREADLLQSKLFTLEGVETSQVAPLRNALEECKEDNRKLAKNMEAVLKANSDLQGGIDVLKDEIDKKGHIIDKLQISREKEESQHKQDIASFEERLENLRKQLSKERDKSHKKSNREINDVRKQLENALSKNGDLSRTNTELRHKITELEYSMKEQKDKMMSLKSQIEHLQRIRGKQEQTIESLQGLQDQLSGLEKAKNDYMKKTKEQSKMIQNFMSQITSLQSEIKALAKAQLDTSAVVQSQEEQLLMKRELIQALQQKYQDAVDREQRLDRLRAQTEEKLQEANNESLQMSSSLQDAHQWFRSKFDILQDELSNAKRSRVDLERERSETTHLLDTERQQAEETTQKAKDMIKSSRETISRLANYAEVAQQQTQDQMWRMRRRLEEEKENSKMMERKLRGFQESSFRHTEELAQELDHLKTHSAMWNGT